MAIVAREALARWVNSIDFAFPSLVWDDPDPRGNDLFGRIGWEYDRIRGVTGMVAIAACIPTTGLWMFYDLENGLTKLQQLDLFRTDTEGFKDLHFGYSKDVEFLFLNQIGYYKYSHFVAELETLAFGRSKDQAGFGISTLRARPNEWDSGGWPRAIP